MKCVLVEECVDVRLFPLAHNRLRISTRNKAYGMQQFCLYKV